MKDIRTIIDTMIKTATDLNTHSIDQTEGNKTIVINYYELKDILIKAYHKCGWDTEDLQKRWFSNLFDMWLNDEYLTYNGLSKFINILSNIYMCYGLANFVTVIIPIKDNSDEEGDEE